MTEDGHDMANTTCEDVRERLSAHVDGELAGGDARAVRDHLTSCEACRSEEEALRRTDRWLDRAMADHPVHDAADEVETEVLRRLEERRPARVVDLKDWFAPAAAAAAALLLAVLVTLNVGRDAPDAATPSAGPEMALVEVPHGSELAIDRGTERLRPVPGASARVRSGDVVHNLGRRPGTLLLSDRSRVDLGDGTSLGVAETDGGVHLGLRDAGAVFCRVRERSTDRPFVVEAAGTRVTVVGTMFGVTRDETGGVRVDVCEGRVRVETVDQRVVLGAGEGARIDRVISPYRDVEAVREALAWVPDRAAVSSALEAALPAVEPAAEPEPEPTPRPTRPAPRPDRPDVDGDLDRPVGPAPTPDEDR